jgi:D-glycero-alpha-D-manno-heptose-7-phosphate kinase
MKIISRAPLRVSFAGGGTDISPYSEDYGGSVFNAAIKKYAYCILEINQSKNWLMSVNSIDRGFKLDRFPLESSDFKPRSDVGLYINAVKFILDHNKKIMDSDNPLLISITTYCDVPGGSGLGTSSAVIVAIVKALDEAFNLGNDEYKLAQHAFHIERVMSNFEGGKQDQYASAFGGFNYMEFGPGKRDFITPLRIKKWIIRHFESITALYYTGQSRDGGAIISAQSSKTLRGINIEALNLIKAEASIQKELILRGDFPPFFESVNKSWILKKKLEDKITNPLIDSCYEAAMSSGASAAKISGAGGGGYMTIFAPIEKMMQVEMSLKSFGGGWISPSFEDDGAQAWVV